MIKLIDILNELGINNPNKTAEEVEKYYKENIYHNNNEFSGDSKGWQEYGEICKPYCEKYDIYGWIGSFSEFQKLSQQDLNKLYRDLKQLVQKYAML